MTMPIDRIDDWEMRLKRQDAFWDNEVIDRPVMHMQIRQPNPQYPHPARKAVASLRDVWLDAEYQAQCALANVMNTKYLGDALPCAYPNLGPEVFSAFFGCEMEYGETTAWSVPNLTNWADVDKVKFSTDNFYWKKIIEFTDLFLEVGKGKFYTGITDLHPGGDAIAAFRDPAEMNIDMLDHPEKIAALMETVTKTYLGVYDFYYNKLIAANQAISSWASIVSSKKFYVPSNDFSDRKS